MALTVIACACALCMPAAAAAAPSDLDPTFGGLGWLVTPVGAASTGSDVAIQPDGKIVVAGFTSSTDDDVLVTRYLENGELDDTFSGDGIQTTSIGPSNEIGTAVAIQPDGKIVVGAIATGASDRDFEVLRYQSNGLLDPMFNGTGKVVTPVGAGNDYLRAIAIAPDGDIVAVGSSDAAGITQYMAIVRYESNGTPETEFDGNGIATPSISPQVDDGATSVIALPDNGMFIGGTSKVGSSYDFSVLKLLANGQPDPTFSGDGATIVPVGSGGDYLSKLLLQPDSKVIAVGSSDVGATLETGIARFDSSGNLDPEFSSDGKFVSQFGRQNATYDAALQPNGKIVAVGSMQEDATVGFGILRVNADGTPDPTLGPAISKVGNELSSANAVAIQADGKIVSTGNATSGTIAGIGVARYQGGEEPPPTPPTAPPIPLSASFAATLKGKFKAKKLKSISGTAAGTGLEKVQISINRIDTSLLKKESRCVFVNNAKAKFKKFKARKKTCPPLKWLDVSGTTSWRFKLSGNLKPGKYKIYARAVGADNATQTTFSTTLGNLRAVKILK